MYHWIFKHALALFGAVWQAVDFFQSLIFLLKLLIVTILYPFKVLVSIQLAVVYLADTRRYVGTVI